MGQRAPHAKGQVRAAIYCCSHMRTTQAGSARRRALFDRRIEIARDVRKGNVSRSISRVLYGGVIRAATIHLGRPLPDASRNQPGRLAWKSAGVSSASSLFGFAPGGVYHAGPVAGPAVGSYPTFSPLPQAHLRRFDLCGTIPEVTLAGHYPAPYFHGARTFLPCTLNARAAARPTDRPPLGHSSGWVNENPVRTKRWPCRNRACDDFHTGHLSHT